MRASSNIYSDYSELLVQNASEMKHRSGVSTDSFLLTQFHFSCQPDVISTRAFAGFSLLSCNDIVKCAIKFQLMLLML